RAVIGELALERGDILAARAPLLAAQRAPGAALQHLAIPGAVVDRDPAVAGRLAPEAIQPRVLLLVGARGCDGVNPQAARVEPARQHADQADLACAGPALEDDQRRYARLEQRLLHVIQALLERAQLLLVRALADRAVEVDLVEHRAARRMT